jgi:hypothetical protein
VRPNCQPGIGFTTNDAGIAPELTDPGMGKLASKAWSLGRRGGDEAHPRAYRTFAHISKRSLDRHVNGDGEL